MDLRKTRHQISLRLQRLYLGLGWLGALAAGLLALAAVELFSVALPAGQAANELEAQVLRLRESPRSGREIKRGEDSSPAAQIAAFERFFPPAADINRVLRDIHAAAEKEGLQLERGEYRLVEEAGLDLLRYQITLPVKGSYANINLFVSRILRDIPSLALDGIGLQRPNAGEAAIEAQIRVSVFHQGVR